MCTRLLKKQFLGNIVKHFFEKMKNLKQEGFTVVGLGQDARSVDYPKKIEKENKMMFVLGTETTGMISELRDGCDLIAEGPVPGIKESLNVPSGSGNSVVSNT
jgi:tRNA G18 (ribose-2'-O)-methylase SpoU